MKGDPHRFDLERFRALNDVPQDECYGCTPDTEPWPMHAYDRLSPAALADQEPFVWSEPRRRGAHAAPGRWERLRAWVADLMTPVPLVIDDDEGDL